MSAKSKKKRTVPPVAQESPPQKVIIVRQDGSTDDLGAEGGLVVFSVAKGGKTCLRTMASRGVILFSVKLVLQLLSETHDAQCKLVRDGQKCAEGLKFGAADLLVAELLAIGNLATAPMPPTGTGAPVGTGSHFN